MIAYKSAFPTLKHSQGIFTFLMIIIELAWTIFNFFTKNHLGKFWIARSLGSMFMIAYFMIGLAGNLYQARPEIFELLTYNYIIFLIIIVTVNVYLRF